MDIKFGKDSNDTRHDAGDGKGKQNALLVVLLLLVGVFAYIYFFTGLIKPAEEKKAGEGAPAATQVAKKPLPPAEGGAAKPEAAPAAKPEAAPAPEAKPVVPEAPKAKADQKPADDVQAAVKKPLPSAAPPAPAKPAAAPAPVKPAAPPAAKPAAAKPAAPPEKKVATVTEAKPQPAKEAEKKPADAKAAPAKPAAVATPAKPKKEAPKPAKKDAAEAPAKSSGTGDWTVLVGNYILEEALAADLTKVRKAGLPVTVVAGGAKKTHMNRLLLAEYTDREAAQAELAKLKKYTSDAFMIDRAGMHAVYAGSYLLDARAASEKDRLGAAGFKLTMSRVDVSIPSKNLVAGTYADKAAAEETLKKLKAAGLKASLTRQ